MRASLRSPRTAARRVTAGPHAAFAWLFGPDVTLFSLVVLLLLAGVVAADAWMRNAPLLHFFATSTSTVTTLLVTPIALILTSA
jgi:hypothetical protein